MCLYTFGHKVEYHIKLEDHTWCVLKTMGTMNPTTLVASFENTWSLEVYCTSDVGQAIELWVKYTAQQHTSTHTVFTAVPYGISLAKLGSLFTQHCRQLSAADKLYMVLGHVTSIWEKRNAHRNLVGMAEEEIPLGRSRHWWEDNINMDLNDWRNKLKLLGSGYRQVRALVNRSRTSGFHEMRVTLWLAEELLASQAGHGVS